ncbi:MAG TPA: hypothetical protein VFG69_20765 [Nannocystaceae bacterium]|nr:hypothetical protein [Nannocystaceae bacterium]
MYRKFLSSFVFGGLALVALPSGEAHAAPSTRDVTLTDIVEQLVPTRLLKGDREFGGHGPAITTTVNVGIVEDGRKLEARVYFKARETQNDWSETKGEWGRIVYTAPSGRKIKRILGAVEDGHVITSPTCVGSSAGRCITSSTSFVSERAGFQFLMPTESWTQWINTIAELVEQVIAAEQQLNDRDQPTPEEREALAVLDSVRRGTAYIPSQGNHVHVKTPDNHGPVRVFAIVGDTGGPDISTDSNGADDTRINSVMFKKLRVELE